MLSCQAGHTVTGEGLLRECRTCGEQRCPDCGDDGRMRPCALCAHEVCGVCLPRWPGPCRGCAVLERDHDADDAWTRAWRSPTGMRIRVGERWAAIEAPTGREDVTVILDQDLHDPARMRLRGLAARDGLPPDLGLMQQDLQSPAHPPDAVTLASTTRRVVQQRVRSGGGSAIATEALELLDGATEPDTVLLGEGSLGVTELLRELRAQQPPPPPSSLEFTVGEVRDRLVLDGDGIADRRGEPHADGQQEREVRRARWNTRRSSTGGIMRRIADAQLGPIRVVLHRLNASFVAEVFDGSTPVQVFIPATPWATLADEQRLAKRALDSGLPPGTRLHRLDQDPHGDRPAATEGTALATPLLAALSSLDRHAAGWRVSRQICDREHLTVPPAPCSSCAWRGCPACDTEVAPTSCRLCTTVGCRRCIRDLCRACSEARRAPEQDTGQQVAWALGGGLLLLVGARYATLQGGPGSQTRTIVPDKDRADPWRMALRAYAAAHQLPPDLGLDVQRPATCRESSGWYELEHLGEFRQVQIITQGSAAVRHEGRLRPEELAELLEVPPDAPPAGVITESSLKLNRLLTRLRGQQRPPPAPAIRVVRTERCVVLAADGLAVLENGRRTSEALWRPVQDPDGWDLAAELGEWRAKVRRVHASALLTVAGPDRPDTTLFVPGWPGARLSAEQVWHRWIQQQGIESGVLEIADEVPDATALQQNLSGHAQLVELVTEARLELGPTSGPRHPATFEDLRRLGASVGLDGSDLDADSRDDEIASLDAPGWGELVGRLPTPTMLTAEVVLHVSQRWAGVGEAIRSSIMRVGDLDARPVLDDIGVRAGDFGVDAAGHLHVPGALVTCTACSTAYCGACQEPMAPCPGCGVPTCSACPIRPALVVAPEEACACCGGHDCAVCSRSVELTSCTLCQRGVCHTCHDDPCRTCRALRPAEPGILSSWPELAAEGLTVLAATDRGGMVAAIVGAQCRELVVVADGRLERWQAQPTDGDHGLLARELRRALALVGEVVIAQGLPPPPADRGQILLTEKVGDGVRCRVTEPGGTQHVKVVSLAPTGRHQPETMPEQVRARFASAIADAPVRPAAAVAELESAWPLMRATLDEDGLHVQQSTTDEARERLVRWSRVGPIDRSIWPQPTSRLQAHDGPIHAELQVFGMVVLLRVEVAGLPSEWTVTGNHEQFLAVAAAQDAGVHDRGIIVRHVVDAPTLRGPDIDGASRIDARLVPRLVPSDGKAALSDGRATRRFLQALGRDPHSLTLPERRLTGPLRSRLLDLVRPELVAPRSVVVEVVETWTDGRTTREVRSTVPPDDGGRGRAICEVSGEARSVLFWCRSGHIVHEVLTCFVCWERTCARCAQRLTTCWLCGVVVCASHSPESRLCQACESLERLGPRWQVRRRSDTPLLAGGDERHRVTVFGEPGTKGFLLRSHPDPAMGRSMEVQIPPGSEAAAEVERRIRRRRVRP